MLAEFQEAIARALSAGAELDTVEAEIINRAPLDEEQRSALWLYGEALTEQRDRQMLAADLGEAGA